jgi:hypothetical protein
VQPIGFHWPSIPYFLHTRWRWCLQGHSSGLETGFQHEKASSSQPSPPHSYFIGPGGGPRPAIIGFDQITRLELRNSARFDQITRLNSEVPRGLIRSRGIWGCAPGRPAT